MKKTALLLIVSILLLPMASFADEALYKAKCASCHGLDGRGGIVGPAIVETKAAKLRAVTQVGPQGMPAYAPGALTDDDLAAIAAYLAAMGK